MQKSYCLLYVQIKYVSMLFYSKYIPVCTVYTRACVMQVQYMCDCMYVRGCSSLRIVVCLHRFYVESCDCHLHHSLQIMSPLQMVTLGGLVGRKEWNTPFIHCLYSIIHTHKLATWTCKAIQSCNMYVHASSLANVELYSMFFSLVINSSSLNTALFVTMSWQCFPCRHSCWWGQCCT